MRTRKHFLQIETEIIMKNYYNYLNYNLLKLLFANIPDKLMPK